MKVFKFVCDSNHFKSLDCDREYYDFLNTFHDQHLESDWSPLPVYFATKGKNPAAIHLSAMIPVFTREAMSILDPLISDRIERLPLKSPDGEFIALNFPEPINGLIKKKSRFTTVFGNIVTIDLAVFRHKLVANEGMFSIPKHYGGVFLTEPVQAAIDEHEIKGMIRIEIGYTE